MMKFEIDISAAIVKLNCDINFKPYRRASMHHNIPAQVQHASKYRNYIDI